MSEDQLSCIAPRNPRDAEGIAPIFLCQSMDQLDLYGTIDACVCCLDSINYVTDPKKLRRAFQRVHLFLMPGLLRLRPTKKIRKTMDIGLHLLNVSRWNRLTFQ